MTIKEAIYSTKEIEFANARVLMQYVCKMTEREIIVNLDEEISDDQKDLFFKYVEQVKNGIPIQYVTHTQYFMGEEFYVDENVLIPQPDTEILVEKAVKIISEQISNDKIEVLDLCTGSGAIAIIIKKYFGDKVSVTASDISREAIGVAQKNEKKILGSNDKIDYVQSDMFENLNKKFDIIVSNPPYIETDVIKTLPLDVQNEPIIALDGGADGLKFYKIIRDNINSYLKTDGCLLMEIGYNQKDSLLDIFKGVECIKDYAGNDRVIVYRGE